MLPPSTTLFPYTTLFRSVEIYAGATVSPPAQRTLDVTAGGGRWSAGPVEGLSDGTYTVQAEQKDKGANKRSSELETLTIDTTRPAVSLSTPAEGAFLGTA